eukprot:TRINITY_DN69304_c0_g1_i6.p2 TRINITY_DN69304_c0_g1~~TRINITY_DN69304_c0_g1_i6.p2  ORF type:complete len:110 (+),score=3.18 TRINITY_DN69304_c0_g1_i6:231-560(+)
MALLKQQIIPPPEKQIKLFYKNKQYFQNHFAHYIIHPSLNLLHSKALLTTHPTFDPTITTLIHYSSLLIIPILSPPVILLDTGQDPPKPVGATTLYPHPQSSWVQRNQP